MLRRRPALRRPRLAAFSPRGSSSRLTVAVAQLVGTSSPRFPVPCPHLILCSKPSVEREVEGEKRGAGRAPGSWSSSSPSTTAPSTVQSRRLWISRHCSGSVPPRCASTTTPPRPSISPPPPSISPHRHPLKSLVAAIELRRMGRERDVGDGERREAARVRCRRRGTVGGSWGSGLGCFDGLGFSVLTFPVFFSSSFSFFFSRLQLAFLLLVWHGVLVWRRSGVQGVA